MVLIALPNFLHGPTALRALSAETRVVVEKPMLFKLSEMDEILRISRRDGLTVATH